MFLYGYFYTIENAYVNVRAYDYVRIYICRIKLTMKYCSELSRWINKKINCKRKMEDI